MAEAPDDAVRMLLRTSLTARDENPLLDLATSEEAIAVMRTMSPAEQEAFLRRDIDMTAAISERLTASGVRLTVSPAVLAGLLRALVFVGMHRDDIGAEVAPSVQAFLVESLARAPHRERRTRRGVMSSNGAPAIETSRAHSPLPGRPSPSTASTSPSSAARSTASSASTAPARRPPSACCSA